MIYAQEVSILRYKFGLSAIVIHYNLHRWIPTDLESFPPLQKHKQANKQTSKQTNGTHF